MEPSPRRHSPDASIAKPSFRKLANDTSGRRYRHHTPDSGSDSSSSDGSPNNIHKKPPSKDGSKKLDFERRQECDRESVREQHNRYGRDNSSYRNSDRHSYGYHRHDGHSRDERETENRMHHRSFRSGQDSKGNSHSERLKRESNFDNAGENWRDLDRYSRDRHDSGGHRSKDKERNGAAGERQRYDRNDHSSDRSLAKNGHKDGGGSWTDKRDRSRSPDIYKNDSAYLHRGLRGLDKGSSSNQPKEIVKDSKEEFGRHEGVIKKQKYSKDLERQKDIYAMDAEKETLNSSPSRRGCAVSNDMGKPVHVQEGQSSSRKKHKTGFSDAVSNEAHHDNLEEDKCQLSSKPVKEPPPKFTSDPMSSATSQPGTVADVSAAKVAAMRVAELVNKNLTVGGIMSTDQKKKLLWGNKKNSAAEEPSHRWDLPLFSDKERQEKFNKLMGVKGDVKLETDNGGSVRSEKQEQLEIDLEKQYTAGLRRRDGRTVGLGL